MNEIEDWQQPYRATKDLKAIRCWVCGKGVSQHTANYWIPCSKNKCNRFASIDCIYADSRFLRSPELLNLIQAEQSIYCSVKCEGRVPVLCPSLDEYKNFHFPCEFFDSNQITPNATMMDIFMLCVFADQDDMDCFSACSRLKTHFKQIEEGYEGRKWNHHTSFLL